MSFNFNTDLNLPKGRKLSDRIKNPYKIPEGPDEPADDESESSIFESENPEPAKTLSSKYWSDPITKSEREMIDLDKINSLEENKKDWADTDDISSSMFGSSWHSPEEFKKLKENDGWLMSSDSIKDVLVKAESEAKKELVEIAPELIKKEVAKLGDDSTNFVKTLYNINELFEYIPNETKDEMMDELVGEIMKFKRRDELTGEPVSYFSSEAEARQFLDSIKDKKRMKSLRWKMPLVWRRIHGEDRKNLTPMAKRTLKSMSIY